MFSSFFLKLSLNNITYIHIYIWTMVGLLVGWPGLTGCLRLVEGVVTPSLDRATGQYNYANIQNI